tara:strand:- start:152 stop:322 length:171 start_codon:yes stop_codon:yes gene_type:complete
MRINLGHFFWGHVPALEPLYQSIVGDTRYPKGTLLLKALPLSISVILKLAPYNYLL